MLLTDIPLIGLPEEKQLKIEDKESLSDLQKLFVVHKSRYQVFLEKEASLQQQFLEAS